ncbi:MAG: O-antigen ligase family protein [Terrimicrobiaceae bacterium]|nr:O-antigen ligase family protein [Terrimicrobiaceae bacterium]
MRIAITVLLALAVIAAQAFYGGLIRSVFSVPAYSLLVLAGVLSAAAVFWRRAIPPRPAVVAAALAAGAYVVLRSMSSPGEELSQFYTWLALATLTAFLVTSVVTTTPSARYTLLGILLAAALVHVGIAAIQFSGEKGFWPLPWFSEQIRQWYGERLARGGRGSGLFLNGNHLAWFLNVVAFLGLAVTCLGRLPLWAKILIGYATACCITGTVLTLSRGGMVGLLSGLTVFLVLSLAVLGIGARDRRAAVLLILLLAAATAVGGGFFLFSQSPRVQARLEGISRDIYRTSLWPAAVRQFQIEPWTGTGAGSFTRLSRMLRDYKSDADDTFAHNDWAQLAADYGAIGLLLVALVFALALSGGLTDFLTALRERMAISSRPQSNSAAFAMGAIAAGTACGAHSFFDFNMQIPANAILAGIVFGLLANPGAAQQPARKGWGRATRIGTALAATLAASWLAVELRASARPEWHALRAENALLQKDFTTAAAAARHGLESSPDHARLRRILGESLLRQAPESETTTRDQIAAVFNLRRSVELDPDERWSRLMLAIAYATTGQPIDAEREHLEAVRLDPGAPAPREYYALFLENSGRTADAIRAYETCLLIRGTTFAHQRLRALRESLKKPAR